MSKRRWNPTYIKRVLKNDIDSSTKPVIVLTDKGRGYFKALGNPEGPLCLAKEFVGTSLADWLGISTFEYGIIHITGVPEIQLLGGGTAQCGPGFITKEEKGEVWNGSSKTIKHIANPEDITRLVCLDTWIRNPDRYSLRKDGTPHERFDNVFLSACPNGGLLLKGFDFSHVLFCDTAFISKVSDKTVYGLFSQFRDFLSKETAIHVCDKLKTVKEKHVRQIIDEIPNEWEVDSATRKSWIEFLTARANFLSKNFLTMIELQNVSEDVLEQKQFLFEQG